MVDRRTPPLRRQRARLGVVTGLALLLQVLLVPYASAAPLHPGGYYREPREYADSGTVDPQCPGLDLSVRFRVHGVASLRNVIGSARQAFLLKDRFRFREVWVDDTDGSTVFAIKGRYIFKETDVRRVARRAVPPHLLPPGGLVGPVFEFKARLTGGDVLTGPDGDVLYLTGGTIVYTALIDSLGDHRPSGTPLRVEVTRIIGPHPLFGKDICHVAARHTA